jgi:predicted outer membrane protein
MKSFLKLCLAATVLFAACTKKGESGIDAVNEADRTFAANTARHYVTNIALGHVAFDHGTDTTVIRLAENMILVSTGAYNNLIEIGRSKAMAMPNSMNDEQEALEASLKAMPYGFKLDSAFLHMLLAQQHTLENEYTTLFNSGNNLTLKDHAERYVDTFNTYHHYTDSLAALY